jgi:deoxyribose-phosphate aldolase
MTTPPPSAAADQRSTDELIDAIVAEVLRSFGHDPGPAEGCEDCEGGCAGSHPDRVRHFVDNGTGRVGFTGNGADVPADLASYIDHTLLRPEASAKDIDRLCSEAQAFGFASVCVNSYWVKRAARNLRGSRVKVASVIGFPFGASPPEIKALEARRAIRDGARELDMVINIGALKSGDLDVLRDDITKVSEACRESGVVLKVIIETAYLTDEEKVIASHLAKQAKAGFVKTSTGYGPGGATVHDVLLMRETVGPDMGVKASGGIRTREDIQDMIAAGATRIGASAGVQIVTGGQGDSQY